MFRLAGRIVTLALAASMLTTIPATEAVAAPHTVTIWGHGYGHGRGMGQWGAHGMAQSGSTWREILRHYYSSVSFGRRPVGERIRVLLRTAPSIVVTSANRFTLQWSDGTPIGISDGRRRYVRISMSGGRHVVDEAPSPNGPWRRRTRSVRSVVALRGREPMELVWPSGASRGYRGTIEARRGPGASVRAINHLPLDEYLLGVVPREMPASWPADALRAQAVAARSYAAALMAAHRRKDYDACPTTACQVYGGATMRARPKAKAVSVERAPATKAVFATMRTVLTHRGTPILAEYSSSTGGRSASGTQPYLRAVADPGDRISPHHAWTVRMDASRIERRFREVGDLRGVAITRGGGGRWGGRADRVRIKGSRKTIDVSGGTFAARMGLRSRWFNVFVPEPYQFRFDMRRGTKANAVAILQRRLRADRLSSGPITTTYGPQTEAGVKRYQRSRKLRVTGVADRATRARLNAEAWG